MSEIKDKIAEINRVAKKSRTINNILWLCIVALVGFSFYLAIMAIDAKDEANKERTKAENLAVRNDSLRLVAVDSKQQLVDNINAAREVLWENAKSINSSDSYSYYVAIYGEDDPNFVQAESAIKALFKEEGYVQILDSDGKTEFFKRKPDSPLGIFYEAEGDRNVNTGVLGSSDFPNARNRANHSIQNNQVVMVLEKYNSGDAVWAKIGYTNL